MADLSQYCGATSDKIHLQKKDNKGKLHNVVEVQYFFVSHLEKNATMFSQFFRVYTQKEGESSMKPWPFGGQKKLSRTKEVKRVKNELAKHA